MYVWIVAFELWVILQIWDGMHCGLVYSKPINGRWGGGGSNCSHTLSVKWRIPLEGPKGRPNPCVLPSNMSLSHVKASESCAVSWCLYHPDCALALRQNFRLQVVAEIWTCIVRIVMEWKHRDALYGKATRITHPDTPEMSLSHVTKPSTGKAPVNSSLIKPQFLISWAWTPAGSNAGAQARDYLECQWVQRQLEWANYICLYESCSDVGETQFCYTYNTLWNGKSDKLIPCENQFCAISQWKNVQRQHRPDDLGVNDKSKGINKVIDFFM